MKATKKNQSAFYHKVKYNKKKLWQKNCVTKDEVFYVTIEAETNKN